MEVKCGEGMAKERREESGRNCAVEESLPKSSIVKAHAFSNVSPSSSVDDVMDDGSKSAFTLFAWFVYVGAIRGFDDENIRLHVGNFSGH